MSPDYFLHRMTREEAEDYIAGQDRRSRQQWEMTRQLGSIICKVVTGEDLNWELPWEDKEEPDEMPDIEYINHKVKKYQRILTKKHGKKS